MPINVYTGLQRSGKSYEVVSNPICEAILQGRRVVTNVDGISDDLVRAYVSEKKKISLDKLGHVVHVTNEDVFKPDFFPYYDDAKSSHTDTRVQPGDLVAIDEAWRFWGSDSKLLKNHKSFFLEHGHFTHPESGVACDLVLMVQDMGTLNRFVKNVVAFSFRTHKKVSLGMSGTYSVQMWEGSKMVKGTLIGNWVRRYDKAVFPLYSSFKGGAEGKMVNADSRQNIFTNKFLWIKLALMLLVAGFSVHSVWRFFHPVVPAKEKQVTNGKPGAPGVAAVAGGSASSSFSSDWRVAGYMMVGGVGQVLLSDSSGRLRLESPSNFQLDGMARIGVVDGQRVTVFSGQIPKQLSAPSTPASSSSEQGHGGVVAVSAPSSAASTPSPFSPGVRK